MERTGTTRRRALMVTGAVAASAMAASATLAGCSSEAPAERRGTAPGPVSAETTLRRRSTAASRALLTRYDAVLLAHPGLAARLTPLRDEVARHVEALAPTEPKAGASAAASATPSPSASASASTPAQPVPADADTAVRELVAAERSTADKHTVALVHAPPEYARLLASVAAAGAVHTYLLTKGAPS
ncbi:hypothetical protein [Streptomyces sp. NPDC002133]|uniref:hypothetical protein n=1 Tax=Streptomyces sp. NPDC002133 TaxID=3154409 RepID=UPI0033344304